MYDKSMEIEFDSDKRGKTLAERGLDFARAGEVFAGPTATAKDDRQAYGEDRYIRAHGGRCLDTARRGPPHHQHEERQ